MDGQKVSCAPEVRRLICDSGRKETALNTSRRPEELTLLGTQAFIQQSEKKFDPGKRAALKR